MSNLITTYRRRILKAALLRHQRKTGSSLLVIKLNKGGISTIELTEILLMDCCGNSSDWRSVNTEMWKV
ncbi:Uncharacterised protein [Klebsiella pneumoniae]|uniref:Uncharacterized protein n=1 Tax=Klebsiella pneumoniae TaxID=573 RepID=A0A377TG68_KLEPN|nr:Uncharacterised protein [Klebsiella pneumoniae]